MTKKAEKKFDAVRTMRGIRDRLSRQIQGMTFEEEMRFLRERVPQIKARRSAKTPKKAFQPTGLGKRPSGKPTATEAARR